ncbi:cytochrome P450 [Punctularia strigosozonata HHB-11173 SS5]|uniref:cytochrome P450 n=1 Tax=Punctularia strigosozonata (strain HHB-11173) TaxID=741275 RepID=UPI000441648E|nr:cytochrome P450 [Punctularia strigosozonata HHB-11173 SS5]EIN09201.1 cytochrome P450 [Punctularia strigosozonata HHB-11173 SS5]
MIDAVGVVSWDRLVHSFSLDAVGATVLGYDSNAIDHDSPFISDYNGIFHEIANPLYLLIPVLERLFPRRSLEQKIAISVEQFQALLDQKREDPGNDVMTLMLRDPNMTNEKLRDNIVVLFIAGHDTSAGSLSTLIYYLGKNPDIQERARQEVRSCLKLPDDPTLEELQSLHYLGRPNEHKGTVNVLPEP